MKSPIGRQARRRSSAHRSARDTRGAAYMNTYLDKKRSGWLALILVSSLLGAVSAPVNAGEEKIRAKHKAFVDITAQAGVGHVHHKPVLDKKLEGIMPWMASVGASVAAVDYDRDGHTDLYVTSSRLNAPNKLYRNNGDGTFTDVAAAAGVASANDEPFMFDLGTAHQKELDACTGAKPCPLSDGLRAAFAEQGIVFTADAITFIQEAQQRWRVADYHRSFTVRKEAGQLKVYEIRGVSMDVAWGDYDNDGHLDLYVVKWGWNILYHANGNGTFTDVTERAGVGDRGNGNAAIWLDYNGDSLLDLYVGNYFRNVNLWHLENARQMHEDFETARDAGANVLYRNNGDGTFTDVSQSTGVGDTGWTLDVGAADYDNDGDQDLVLANDFGQDRVYRVNADATFTDVTDHAIGWDTHKGMNVDFGDFNNDGHLDLYITNIWTKEYVKEGNQLYRNMGDGTFSDISFEANVYDAGWCWAGRFWDYDNDGRQDLMVANGYISANPDDEYFSKLANTVTKPGFDPINAQNWPMMGDSTFSGYEPSRVWHNEGNEIFAEKAKELGLADVRDGRGLGIADFDNDGDLDVYISNQGQDGVLYRNDLGNRNNWLQIELRGTHCNRDAIGTRVTVVSEGLSQIRELDGGNGDHSQCPYRLHFGLGQRKAIAYLEIRWPTGYVERFEDVKPNCILQYTEDTPQSFLEERKSIREAEIAALEAKRHQAGAAPDQATEADAPPMDWSMMMKYKKQYMDFVSRIRQTPDDPRLRYEFALLLDKQERKRAALGELERAIHLDPHALLYSNEYRTLIRSYGSAYYDQSIRFFEDLVEQYPRAVMPRLNKALAYVDKMPYPKLGIVSQGKLSNKSLAELDVILTEIDPGCWTAKFIRGMNHLHWPRKLNHAPLAIRDFTELIEMQRRFPPEKQLVHFALGYVGLGDSYVKNRDQAFAENLKQARQAWEQGQKEYPDTEELRVRLELYDKSADHAEVIEYVKRLRGLEDPVDTDLARVWVD
ncbi:MAG: hypothetical protein GY842_00265 [bacterium]|nr:hypothetical protein [bacterium]